MLLTFKTFFACLINSQCWIPFSARKMSSLPPNTLPTPPAPISRPAGRAGRSTPRRSSSRSIKRKKFDDELVESSLKKASKQRGDVPGLEKEIKRTLVSKWQVKIFVWAHWYWWLSPVSVAWSEVGGSVVEWFRVLDLKSGVPGSNPPSDYYLDLFSAVLSSTPRPRFVNN